MYKYKLNTIVVIGIVAILIIGVIALYLIVINHQENNLIIEKCFNHFDNVESVVIKKDSVWSPVTCEKK